MAGYRRFVAYVYEYPDEKKGDGKGFIKVEVRDGRCRMNYRISGIRGRESVPCKIYGFVRRDNDCEGILLGECDLAGDVVQFQQEMPEIQLGGSPYELGDLGGLIMLSEDGMMYGTGWDEKPVRLREINLPHESVRKRENERNGNMQKEPEAPKETEVPGENEVPRRTDMPEESAMPRESEMPGESLMPEEPGMSEKSVISEKSEITEKAVMPGQSDMLIESAMPEGGEMPEESEISKEFDILEEADVPRNSDAPKEADVPWNSDAPKEADVPGNMNVLKEADVPGNMNVLKEADTPWKSDVNEGTAISEEAENIRAAGEPGGTADEERADEPEDDWPFIEETLREDERYETGGRAVEETADEENSTWNPAGDGQEDGPDILEELDQDEDAIQHMRRVQREEETRGSDFAEAGQDSGSSSGQETGMKGQGGQVKGQETQAAVKAVFCPFADGEIVDCTQITPADYRILSHRDRGIMNNNFLRHGYYRYHHVLLGRRREDGRYILGVPGVYNRQECLMAGMFGFPNFKAAKGSKNSQRFGYWFRLIDTPGIYRGNRP